MKCDYCGREEPLPFVCNYCGGAFCPDHRLPEAHQCKGDLSQKRTIIAPPQTTFTWQTPTTTSPIPTTRQNRVFSRIEVRDIIVAWVALGVAFSFVLEGGGIQLLVGSGPNLITAVFYVGVSLVTVGPGFVFHELSHKFLAQRYGYWAEFRMWPAGLLLALVTGLIGLIFAAPGATYISGMNISKSENGKISLAGPLTNIAIALLFLPLNYPILQAPTSLLGVVGYVGLRVNAILGLFNMLPIGPLDGAKVFSWNLLVWIAMFIPLGAAFVYLNFG